MLQLSINNVKNKHFSSSTQIQLLRNMYIRNIYIDIRILNNSPIRKKIKEVVFQEKHKIS